MTLPLRPNYFKCPPLGEDEKDYLLTQAHRICQETALNALTIVKNPTTKVIVNQCTKRRAQLHYGTDIIDSNMYGITGKTQIKTSYEELIEFFHLTTQKKVRTFGNVVGQAILDRITLYNLTDQADNPSSAFIYAGVQWSVIECNVIHPSLTLKRDTCFLEVLNYITVCDPDTGELRRGFIRAVHSLALDCCPSLRSTHNIVRSALVRSGHLFLETEQPGVFDYYYAYVVADPGKTPKFFNIKVFQRIVGQMLNLEYHLALKRLPKLLQSALNFPNRPYKSTRCIHYCEACDTKFKVLYSKHHCFFCRQVVCTSCIQTYKVPVAGREKTKVEVCTECFCGNKPKRGRSTHSAHASEHSGSSGDEVITYLSSPWYYATRTASMNFEEVQQEDMWTNNRPTLYHAVSSIELASESSFCSYESSFIDKTKSSMNTPPLI